MLLLSTQNVRPTHIDWWLSQAKTDYLVSFHSCGNLWFTTHCALSLVSMLLLFSVFMCAYNELKIKCDIFAPFHLHAHDKHLKAFKLNAGFIVTAVDWSMFVIVFGVNMNGILIRFQIFKRCFAIETPTANNRDRVRILAWWHCVSKFFNQIITKFIYIYAKSINKTLISKLNCSFIVAFSSVSNNDWLEVKYGWGDEPLGTNVLKIKHVWIIKTEISQLT